MGSFGCLQRFGAAALRVACGIDILGSRGAVGGVERIDRFRGLQSRGQPKGAARRAR